MMKPLKRGILLHLGLGKCIHLKRSQQRSGINRKMRQRETERHTERERKRENTNESRWMKQK